MPRSTVSAAIQALEVHGQASLLQRTTRKIQLTTEGKLYLEWCLQLLSNIEDTEQPLCGGQRKPNCKLSVSVPGRIASPGHLQRFGLPQQLQDLGHQMVNYASPITGRALNFEYLKAGQSWFLSLPALVSINCVES
ncbi:MAG: LysR family transcriptional regulator [Gammaproteobacteria bacterium]|nr:LysR family transcriptional regulator [Gammaproteobacteria bacterium]